MDGVNCAHLVLDLPRIYSVPRPVFALQPLVTNEIVYDSPFSRPVWQEYV
jgi:hypothetical protein